MDNVIRPVPLRPVAPTLAFPLVGNASTIPSASTFAIRRFPAPPVVGIAHASIEPRDDASFGRFPVFQKASGMVDDPSRPEKSNGIDVLARERIKRKNRVTAATSRERKRARAELLDRVDLLRRDMVAEMTRICDPSRDGGQTVASFRARIANTLRAHCDAVDALDRSVAQSVRERLIAFRDKHMP